HRRLQYGCGQIRRRLACSGSEGRSRSQARVRWPRRRRHGHLGAEPKLFLTLLRHAEGQVWPRLDDHGAGGELSPASEKRKRRRAMTLAQDAAAAAPRHNTGFWAGRIISGLAAAFLIFDVSIKFSGMPIVAQTMEQLGYPVSTTPVIGGIEAIAL